MMGRALGDIKLSTYSVLSPELYLLGCTLFLLIYGVYRVSRADNVMIFTSIIVLGLTAWLECAMFHGKVVVLNGMYISDPFALMAKCLVLGASMLVLLLSTDWLRQERGRPFEFIILIMLATLGMLLMVSANDFMSMYMALEMSSLSLYVLASFTRDHAKSSEAGLKYFVLGALASGMMLFGMSLVYGFAGATNFDSLAKVFAGGGEVSKSVIVGMILIVVGLCFKVSAVPFHMWTPDVYEGAPTPVTAFFAAAPKAAALLLFTRVMLQPFGDLVSQWQQVIIFVSIGSMVVGSLAGIMQSNIKRLLAYSSIGHVGFILMGLAASGAAGVQAMLVYIAVYIVMSAGAFGCLLLLGRNGPNHTFTYVEEIKDLSGLAQTHPAKALALSLFMFSMAGIPPLAGFFGKMYVVLAAIGAGLTWLAVIGVVTSVISGFYYIKIVKVMYFDPPQATLTSTPSRYVHTGVAFCAVLTLLFFLVPTPLVSCAKWAAEALLH